MKPRPCILSLLLAVFVVYPLSIGPVVRIHHKTNPNRPMLDAANTFYSPLFWFVENCRPMQNPFVWYVNLWLPDEPDLSIEG
jgi:hypothetical protein